MSTGGKSSGGNSGFAARALALTLLLRFGYSALAAAFIRIPLPLDSALAKTNALWAGYSAADGWKYLLLGPWQRYDALWYEHIAISGYDFAAATVFYPLYPLALRALHGLFLFAPVTLCGLLLATTAAFFFFWGFQKLAAAEDESMSASAGLILFCFWPTGFILFAGYAEALLLAFLVWSFWFGRRQQWWLAGGLGFLAGLTRATGCLVAIPLAYAAWKEWRREGFRISMAAVALPALAWPVYQLWLRAKGFPAPTEIYREHWNTEVAMPWTTFATGVTKFIHEPGWVLGASLAAIVIVTAAALLARREYAVFCWAGIAFFLLKDTSPALQSSVRYSMIAFPAFAALGKLPRLAVAGLAAVFLLLNLGSLFLFVHWGLIV